MTDTYVTVGFQRIRLSTLKMLTLCLSMKLTSCCTHLLQTQSRLKVDHCILRAFLPLLHCAIREFSTVPNTRGIVHKLRDLKWDTKNVIRHFQEIQDTLRLVRNGQLLLFGFMQELVISKIIVRLIIKLLLNFYAFKSLKIWKWFRQRHKEYPWGGVRFEYLNFGAKWGEGGRGG